MAAYQLTASTLIRRVADNVYIPPDPANNDYAEYLKWVALGNVPDPFVVPPVPATGPDANARLNAGILAAVATIQTARDAVQAIPAHGALPARLDALIAQMKVTMDAFVAMLHAQQNPP